ncbi:MAG: GGDEF domain-containing protein, partial [Inquilinus sp.]|nr:GGDEF domain-containing protein [Inquilinus sp.]
AAPAASPPTRSVGEVATFLGIPTDELTPSVREGLAKLIAELERLNRDSEEKDRRINYLERLADEDPLMPILNRRAYLRELSRMMAFVDRYGGVASVLFFDVDSMKAINDAHGHAAGDVALSHVANMLVRNVRGSDIVGRLGGDEFGVLLVQADQAAANGKGAALAEIIGSTPFVHEGQELRVAVSYGAFAFTGAGEATEVIDAADKAMYQRKRGTPGQ